jgi:hypothetical protein
MRLLMTLAQGTVINVKCPARGWRPEYSGQTCASAMLHLLMITDNYQAAGASVPGKQDNAYN